MPLSEPAPAAAAAGTAGTDRARDHPRGGAERGGCPARRAEPRGGPAGWPRDRAGHRAQSCPAGPAGAPGVRSPGRPPVQSGDIARDTCKRGLAGVRSRRRCEAILDAGLALWLSFFFPLLPLSFSFQLLLFLDPRLSPPTERERERKKKGHVCLEKYVGQWNIPCTCAQEPGRESSSAALSLPTAPARPSRRPPRVGGRRAPFPPP